MHVLLLLFMLLRQMADSLAQIQMQQGQVRDFGLVHRKKRPAIEDLRTDDSEEALLFCDLVEGELRLKPSLLGLDSLAMAFKGPTGPTGVVAMASKGPTGVEADKKKKKKKKTKKAESDDCHSSAA